MPFGKPFFFLPVATAGNMLSAYFTFGFQGHVLPEAKAWERTLKRIRYHFPCPGFHDGYQSFVGSVYHDLAIYHKNV